MKGSGVRSPAPEGTTPYPGGPLSPRLLGVPLLDLEAPEKWNESKESR